MLRRVETLTQCSVRATDGAIGRVTDAYFDDQQWTVRYLVVDTGMWLGWHVLVSPQSISAIDWDESAISLSLTREQIERSPRADLQHPLSRLYETEFYTHFGYPPYWDAPSLWASGGVVPALDPVEAARVVEQDRATATRPVESAADSRVRSWREVKGSHIHAADGEIGHVDDLLVDDRSWLVHFIEVDTSNWIGGTSVVVPRNALGTIDWAEGTLSVTLTRDQVKQSPRVDQTLLDAALEEKLRDQR